MESFIWRESFPKFQSQLRELTLFLGQKAYATYNGFHPPRNLLYHGKIIQVGLTGEDYTLTEDFVSKHRKTYDDIFRIYSYRDVIEHLHRKIHLYFGISNVSKEKVLDKLPKYLGGTEKQTAFMECEPELFQKVKRLKTLHDLLE